MRELDIGSEFNACMHRDYCRSLRAELAQAKAEIAIDEQHVADLMVDVDRIARERDAANALLRDLLAVIHRDGGHYTGAHGIEKSALDAQAVVNADRVALDAANTLLRRCRVAVEQLNERFRCDGLLCDIDAHLGESNGEA